MTAERAIHLGAAVRAARGRMTQGELAAALGVDQPTISKWERDDIRPSLEQLRAIEETTGRRRGFILIAAGVVEDVTSVEDAIEAHPDLSEEARRVLLRAFDGALEK